MMNKLILFIINPHSGKQRGLAVFERVKPIFAAQKVELDVHFTEKSGGAICQNILDFFARVLVTLTSDF